MTNKSQKPVKQCEGCKLNLGERCAAFEHPHEQWLHKDCDGYNDEKLIKKYGLGGDSQGAHARKAKRQEEAKYENTIEHPIAKNNWKKKP